jgi:hypothetical protein
VTLPEGGELGTVVEARDEGLPRRFVEVSAIAPCTGDEGPDDVVPATTPPARGEESRRGFDLDGIVEVVSSSCTVAVRGQIEAVVDDAGREGPNCSISGCVGQS